MKRLSGLVFVGLLFLCIFCTPAMAFRDNIKVMTRNQYLGADLNPLFLVQTPEDLPDAMAAVLEQIAFNYFPLRARRLAAEIALTQPDLIGLQEVFDFKLNGLNIGPPFVDHLSETLDALSARGQSYNVAAIVVNSRMMFPFDVDGDGVQDQVSVVDRDVILAREGVSFTKLDGYFTEGGLCGVRIPVPSPVSSFPAMLQSVPSQDGCNYTVSVEVTPPVGPPIAIIRGFVGVDATVRGKNYRFVTTHLEVEQPDPTEPNGAIIQFLQAVELVGTLQSLTAADRALILVGDFNSSVEDDPIGSIIPPYRIIAGAGFKDVWDRNPLRFFDPNGYTCCELKDLSNTRSLLDERIDIIFVRDTRFLPLVIVTGRMPIFPLRVPPNWASDHGGVFGKLIFK